MTTIKTLRDYREEELELRKIEVRTPGVSNAERPDRKWFVAYARFAGNTAESWSLTQNSFEAAWFSPRQVRIIRRALKKVHDYNVKLHAPAE